MNNIKIAHEVPLPLLEESIWFNDYDYVIASHVKKYPEYRAFYLQRKTNGRYSIMDNGLFEDGVPMSDEEYFELIKEFRPDEFIIPDHWNDCKQTIDTIRKWNLDYIPKLNQKTKTVFKSIGVVQGRTYEDAVRCYLGIRDVVDKVAFNYLGEFYKDIEVSYNDLIDIISKSKHKNFNTELENYFRILTRRNFLLLLLETKILRKGKPHHLLGCVSPIEFKFYKEDNFSFIQSLDTSHPIVTALTGHLYSADTILQKSTIKIDDVMYSSCRLDFLKINVKEFRDIVNG